MNEMLGHTLGPYRIVEKIGEGGMATVYKAYQPSLDRDVAIKILPPVHAKQPGFTERFQREAKAVAKLHHPNILPVYDYGQEDEYSYLAMRYVEGAHTLKAVMAQSLALDQAADLIGQIAAALDHAHQQGIVHRDVKPSNVLMDGDWAQLTDFGLAKMTQASVKLTGTGVGVGTPAYMSPEQGQGATVDRRSDIYSLGVILFEMLTGQIPHDAETPFAIVLKRVTEPLPMPRDVNPDIPPAVERVLLKALATDPDDRYATAGAFAADLKRAVTQSEIGPQRPISAPPTIVAQEPTAQKLGQRQGFRPGWVGLAAGGGLLLLAVLACGAVLYRTLGSGGSTPAPTPPPTETEAQVAAVGASTNTATPTSSPTTPVVPTATHTASATPTATQTASPTSTPTSTATSTPNPTVTPTPSPTPRPTSTPTPPGATLSVSAAEHVINPEQGAQLPLSPGTYRVTLDSSMDLYGNVIPLKKVIVFATTDDDPHGWFWIVEEGQTTTITLTGQGLFSDRVHAFVLDVKPEDNSGRATLTFRGEGDTQRLTLDPSKHVLNPVQSAASQRLSPGTYQVSLNATLDLHQGRVPVEKVLLYATTDDDPYGWFWIAEEGRTTTVRLTGKGANSDRIYASVLDLWPPENGGSATLTFTER